jgi:hypothetical protein
MGPNPKFIFQGLILLVGIFIFAVTIVMLKIRSGKSFKEILAGHNRLSAFSLGSALVLFIVLFLALVLINN